MSIIHKIINRGYLYYLKIFYREMILAKDVFIDYRCEIDKKNNIKIGSKSILYKNITIYKKRQGSFSVGHCTHIAPYGYFLIGGQQLKIGNNVAIAPYCSIFCISNAIPSVSISSFKDSYCSGDIVIGNNVFVGAQCIVLPNVIIEDNVVVAANSTIKGTLQSGFLYGGSPAVKIKELIYE